MFHFINLFQDEYSIFPQTYSIDINGYILVYSVTSNKRYMFTLPSNISANELGCVHFVSAEKEYLLLSLPALKLYKLSMKNSWIWWEKFSKYSLFSCPSLSKPFGIYHTQHCGILFSPQRRVPIMLVGNKNDLHMERYVLALTKLVFIRLRSKSTVCYVIITVLYWFTCAPNE